MAETAALIRHLVLFEPQKALDMDYQKAVERIYEHLENDHPEKAVMACLRVARAAKDYLNAAIFLRELYPDTKEVARALYDDIAPLSKEAQKLIFEKSLERWLDLHVVKSHTPADDETSPKVNSVIA